MLLTFARNYQKDGTPPQSSQPKGAAIRQVMQMAEYDKENRNLNAGVEKRRRTPRDLEITGTFVNRTESVREVRPPTASETRANNHAKTGVAEACGRIGDWAPVFKKDLEEMNRGKTGVPFRFSDSMIWWILCVMTAVNTDFRFISGFLAGILPSFGLEPPSYSRLNERCNELIGKMLGKAEGIAEEHYGDRVLAVHVCDNIAGRTRRAGIDSSGINLSNTNLWRTRKWKTSPKNRGWLILHALCDVDTGEILAYAVTDETVGDSPMLEVLVKAAKEKGHAFDTLYADGAYSSKDNWVFLSRDNDIRFVTSFKSNTRPKNNGCSARGNAARLWCSLPYDEWVKESGYGMRWKCECVFSDLKRLFPEAVTASSEKGILRQLFSRIEMFNRYKSVRAEIVGVTGNGIAVA